MCQAGLISFPEYWENWEWGEDDLNPETVLELEQFGLSMSYLFQAVLNITFTFLQHL